MKLLVRALTADMVLLGVEESKHDTMLQMLSPGDVEWQNVRSVKHACEIPLPVQGVQYMFRLADETGQTAFPGTSVKVLTPPAPPAVLGIGRNVCISWDNNVPRGMPTEVAASVVEQSGLQYIVSWRREYGRGGNESRSYQPSHSDKALALVAVPEPEGHMELRRRDAIGVNGSILLLAAFPPLQEDADYRITLRTVSSGEDSDVDDVEIFQSAESPAVHWFTGLNPPAPLSRIAASNEMTLKLPVETDSGGVLAALGLKAQRLIEAQDEGADTFQRLGTRAGTALASGETVSIIGIPADARCGIRMRCSLDLRALGANHFFWDTTAVLEVETVPNPPRFCGSAFDETSMRRSLLISWPLRTITALFRDPPEPATYQVQIYSRSTGTFATVASTSSSSLDLLDLDCHGDCHNAGETREIPDFAPGICACVRLLRTPSNPASLSLPAHQAATVVLLAPLPPIVALLPPCNGEMTSVARISWDGALDVEHLPETVTPLPFEVALQVE